MSHMEERWFERVRKLRNDRSLTQLEVSVGSGVDRSHLSRIERGTKGVSLDSLFSLMRFYGASLDQLYNGYGPTLPEVMGEAPERDPEEASLLQVFRNIDPGERQALLQLLHRMTDKRKKD